ncbi:MAG: TonB-dependent receptor [Acidobacteriota bacterium]
MRALASSLAIVLCLAGSVSAAPQGFAGRRLDEALSILQHEGLPIVFSSEIVTPSMRVAAEPRGGTPRDQLHDLLAAHGLRAQAGPGHTILVVRDRPTAIGHAAREAAAPVVTPGVPSATPPAGTLPPAYADRITVRPMEQPAMHRGSQTMLDAGQVRAASGPMDSDGLDVVRTLPGVVSGDDFRTDFSVRGSPYDQVGIVIDGVATRWLQYTMYGRRDAGSLSMIGGDLLDRVTLQAGAFPRLYADSLGAQVDLTIKEGSRASTRFTGAVGGLSAAAAGEGPVGQDRRGSWLVGIRESYQSWPAGESSRGTPGFGFADLHGKLVYDASPREQISVTALAGRSALDTTDQSLGALLGSGTDTAGLVTAALHSTLNARTFFQQRVYFAGQTMTSTVISEPFTGHVANDAFGYRGEAFHSVLGAIVDGGVEVASRSGSQQSDGVLPGSSHQWRSASWTTRAVFVNLSGSAPHGVTFQAGGRLSESTLVNRRAFSPWALAGWRVAPGWRVTASAGQSHQFPELDALVGQSVATQLLPEQATHVDLGVEHQLPRLEWHASLFDRFEHNVLRPPIVQPVLVLGELVAAPGQGQYANALDGSARGVEVGAASAAFGPVSGWFSYTYSLTRQTDVTTGETYWANLDRRHVLNLTSSVQAGGQTTVGVTLRAASGVPIPGDFAWANGALFVGDQRNVVRLSPYARLDLRVNRRLFSSHHAMTVSAEVLNALNRTNVGIADGIVQPRTGEAMGFSKPLEGRTFAVGLGLNLSR